jgi:lipopolysaccharide export system protein LptA
MIRTTLVALALAGSLALAAASPRPSRPAPPPSGGTTVNFGVWTVHMSSVNYNLHTGNFNTPSHLTMTRNGGDVAADRASGNLNNKSATLLGNVVVHDMQGAFDVAGPNVASRGPATLTTDQLKIDAAAKEYTAIGRVHYFQADTMADAQKGVLNDQAHMMVLQGSVRIVQGDRSLSAQNVRYNTVTGDAHAEGDVIMQFPGGPGPRIATPKPIKNPFSKKSPPPALR